jgi:hypothetical protein
MSFRCYICDTRVRETDKPKCKRCGQRYDVDSYGESINIALTEKQLATLRAAYKAEQETTCTRSHESEAA